SNEREMQNKKDQQLE
nr:catalase isozyme III {N-terminal} [Bacillus firmus, OF4, Peptide Partial, 15 aa] [Cytobacillus firmus]